MENTWYFVFFLGTIISFLGTLPLGPINLSVVDTTIKHGTKPALFLSFAASLVEIIMVFIAIWCSMAFTDLLSLSSWTKWVAVFVLIGLGLFFWLQPNKSKDVIANTETTTSLKENRNAFFKGILLAFLNPQAVPFWFFVLSALDSAEVINLSFQSNTILLTAFLIGTSVGKFFSLWVFAALSKVIEKRAGYVAQYINKAIGGILILLGSIQLIRLLI